MHPPSASRVTSDSRQHTAAVGGRGVGGCWLERGVCWSCAERAGRWAGGDCAVHVLGQVRRNGAAARRWRRHSVPKACMHARDADIEGGVGQQSHGSTQCLSTWMSVCENKGAQPVLLVLWVREGAFEGKVHSDSTRARSPPICALRKRGTPGLGNRPLL
eukprot:540105-Rhodomonas_salina.2